MGGKKLLILVLLLISCSTIVMAQDWSISLSEGWNLISIPLTLDDNSVNNIFNNIDVIIYGYNGDWFTPDVIEPLRAYWVKADSNIDITVTGTIIRESTFSLSRGWNH